MKWQRCDAAGAACTVVSGTPRYTVQATDAGSTFKLSVTVGNGLGSTTASSALSLPSARRTTTPAPREHGPARDLGHRAGREHVVGVDRIVVEQPDGLRVPVAPLRLDRRELHGDLRGDLLGLHAR